MSRYNKNNIDLNSNDINEITTALLLIYNHTQEKIKSITFQNNAGILNFGANKRIQIQLSASELVSCVESEKVINSCLIFVKISFM